MSNQIIINKEKKADFSLPYDFPLKIYETNLEEKPHRINDWHWHDEFQFCIVTSGTILITIQEKKFELKEGEGFFLNSGILHMTRSNSSVPAKYICINMHPSFLSFFRGSILEQKYVLPYLENKEPICVLLKPQTDWQNLILEEVKNVTFLMRTLSYGYELEVYLEIITMWKNLVLHTSLASKPASSPFNHKEIKLMLSFIQKHYSEHISLDDIAGHVHASKSWCCRIFKQALNCTILEYLTEVRIEKSIHLLLSTDLSITEVAYRTGFSDTSYFIKKFHQSVHLTPYTYRKQSELLQN